VYVNVENHMATSASYFVQVKIVNNLPATFPVDAQPSQVIDMGTINNDGKPVQQTAIVTQNTPGSYSVVFELYRNNGDGALVFTQNYCVLNIQVTN
jgi:hypothetical protein